MNIELRCPHRLPTGKWCDTVFRIAAEPGDTVRCPYCRKNIVLNNPKYYRVIQVKKLDPVETNGAQTTSRTNVRKRTKYRQKRRRDRRQ